MRDAGILEGDFVVVRPTDEAANGEIVVALLGDEATVKRFYRERNAIAPSRRTKPTSRSGHRTRSCSARSSEVFRQV